MATLVIRLVVAGLVASSFTCSAFAKENSYVSFLGKDAVTPERAAARAREWVLSLPTPLMEAGFFKVDEKTAGEEETATDCSMSRIMLSGKDSKDIVVGYFTKTWGANMTSSVRWGTASGQLNQVAKAPPSSSPQSYLWGKYGFHHFVEIPASTLPPKTRIFYACGSSGKEWSFTTPPAVDSTVKLSMLGDWGYGDSTERKMWITLHGLEKNWSAKYTRALIERQLNAGNVDLMWLLGDIGYIDDCYSHNPLNLCYEDAYNGFMSNIENVTATVPTMVSPGNHESECHSPTCLINYKYGLQLKNFTAFNARWKMPAASSGGKLNMWYSSDFGPLHLVSLNTETDFPTAEERKTGDGHFPWLTAGSFGFPGEYTAWLEADLKKASEARAAGKGRPWIVAGGHRPYQDLPDNVLALFQKYGVDMYFAGHTHSYLRSQNINGTTYIVTGGSGCEEMAPGSSVTRNASSLHAVVATDKYSSGFLEANATSLKWQLLDASTSEVIDQVVVLK